jgi:GntR family transcriptional regulator
MMNLNIDRNLDISIYNQIVNQIILSIENGVIKPGERLPAQRELSAGLNISRGTIQKAYEELEKRGIVEILKGSGCFAAKKQEIENVDRKEAAVYLADELIQKLENLNYTSGEIQALIDMRIIERENMHNSVRIAAIDCNPEALEIFKIQFSLMKNVLFRIFIIDDILTYSQPDKVFEDYDIIITTLNHYDEISGILYSLREKLFKVAVSPSSETIIKIATIPQNSRIGIITESMKFRDIMFIHLESFNIDKGNMEHALETEMRTIKRFLREKDFLIIPQSYKIDNTALTEELQGFIRNGGKIIEFIYQIERGSLIYIQEQMGNILHSRQALNL